MMLFSPRRKSKVTEGTSPQGKYTLVDITGTYNKPVGEAVEPTRPLPDARMLAAILHPKEDLHYCVILSGPKKTVTAAAKAFRDSFGADAKREKELKLEEGSN
jgi:gluconolactonase